MEMSPFNWHYCIATLTEFRCGLLNPQWHMLYWSWPLSEVTHSLKILCALDDRNEWKGQPYKVTETQVQNPLSTIPKTKKLWKRKVFPHSTHDAGVRQQLYPSASMSHTHLCSQLIFFLLLFWQHLLHVYVQTVSIVWTCVWLKFY